MFSVRKLQRLPPRTRLRKLMVLIRDEEQRILDGRLSEPGWLLELVRSQAFLEAFREESRPTARNLADALAASLGQPLRALDRLRHAILAELGVPWADWDQLLPGAALREPPPRRVFPARVYLEDLRSPYNVGAIFRTAEAFGVEHVYLSPATPLPTLPRARRTSRGVTDLVPWSVCSLEQLAERAGCDPASAPSIFALETGGTPMERFRFPRCGIVLVGGEELGLSPEALALADASAGRVSIPMAGERASLNVAVAFGILMHAWYQALVGGSGGREPKEGGGEAAGPSSREKCTERHEGNEK